VPVEIKACGEVLRAIVGRAPRWFRPPGGEYDPQVAAASRALGYTMVLWTDDPGACARAPGARTILTRTLSDVSNGGIILPHDGIQQTIDVLPQIIETLGRHGFRIVTVDERVSGSLRTQDGPVIAASATLGVARLTG
jgi:peptidoglycan/xylan/chitin deacetylase (PgdA/CDA1 family)